MHSIFASRKGKLTLKHASEEPRYTLNDIYIDRSAHFKFQKLRESHNMQNRTIIIIIKHFNTNLQSKM